MDPLILLVVLLLLIACSAFYAASEIAIVSLPQVDVAAIKKKHPKLGKKLEYHRDDPQRFVINISIANNFINILASSLATATMVALFPKYGILIATFGMTFLILMFGEIIPKVLAISYTKYIAQKSAAPLWVSAIVLTPAIWVFSLVVKLIAKEGSQEEIVSSEALKYYVRKGHEHGAIDKTEREYISNILQMDLTDVANVMTPSNQVVSIPKTSSVAAASRIMLKSGFSRVPVFDADPNNIIGIVHAKDLLQKLGKTKITNFIRKPFFVPTNRKVDDMLTDFQKEDHHFAIVIDPDGQYQGIVTIEDVIEEIIGEIYDETDKKVVFFKQLSKQTFHIQGDYSLADFNKKFNTKLQGARTLGGYVVYKMQRLPEVGESVNTALGKFEVLHIVERKIKKIKLTTKKPFSVKE